MNTQKRERRDWTFLIFIIPIGIFLILIVGQLAIQLVPTWRVNADMNSNLEPDPNSARPFALLEPILPQILTPMAWLDVYLTPGADISFPPFLTFEPTASPSPTAATPSATASPPTPIATTSTPVPTSTTPPPPTGTEPPNGSPTPPTTCTDPQANNQGQPLPCTYPPTTCTDPLANNQGQPLPCTYPPTTCTDPLANNQGQPLPCTYDPTTCTDPLANNQGQPLPCTYDPTCTDPAANNYGGPLPCDYIDTMPTDYVIVDPPPTDIGTTPDDNDANVNDGTYVVISLNVEVGNTPDDNYDLAFYEYDNGGYVYLDWIIIGISNDPTGADYYEVFSWGTGGPDENSNVGDVAVAEGGEYDNQQIDLSELHDPDGAGTAPQTGILIDVDTADSAPPPGIYQYVVIISPDDSDVDPANGAGSGDPADIDAIQTVEVLTPPP